MPDAERRPPRRAEIDRMFDLILSGKLDVCAALERLKGEDLTIDGQMRRLQEQMDAERRT